MSLFLKNISKLNPLGDCNANKSISRFMNSKYNSSHTILFHHNILA